MLKRVLDPSAALSCAAALAAMLAGPVQGQCTGELPSDSQCSPRDIPGAPGHYEVHMDVSTATPDLEAACWANIGHTVWFSISPTEDSHITFSTCDPHTKYDTVVQGYLVGDCEFPQRVDTWCDDDSPAAACVNECWPAPRASIVTVQATAGTTYFFQVGSYNNNSAGCELCLGVSVVIGPTPPINDDCFDAESIGETTLAFDTTGATTDGPPIPESCNEGAGTSCVQDIWYRYTASCTGVAMVDLCGSAYDTRIAVYDTDQCPGDMIACNDDSCGLQSRVQFPAVQGTEYLIRVGGYSGSGTGTMTVTCAPNLYLDLSEFEQDVAAAGYVELAFEDFSEANLPPPPSEATMNDPLDDATNNGVFAPGDVVSGLVFQSNLDGSGEDGVNPRGGAGLVASMPLPPPTPVAVAANVGNDGFDIVVTPLPIPRPAAIGLRLADLQQSGELVVSVYDVNDALLSQVTVTGEADGSFLGATPISIPAPGGPTVEIGRINVWAPAGTREGVYEIRTYGPPPCAADINESGVVDFQDLLLLLAGWGPCPGCPADIDGSDAVDFQDLLQLLAAWGPCT